jgi:cytochrome c oxidase subunit 4
MNWAPSRALVISWLSLLSLLGLTVYLAYQPLGSLNLAVALTIALTKALIVAAVFMELRERGGITIAFAAAGFVWLAILLWLSGSDYLTRPPLPMLAVP